MIDTIIKRLKDTNASSFRNSSYRSVYKVTKEGLAYLIFNRYAVNSLIDKELYHLYPMITPVLMYFVIAEENNSRFMMYEKAPTNKDK